jgi:APA family basic amino acid/polyamine antiporter
MSRALSAPAGEEPSRLARRLGLGDAVVIGLSSMIGAGVFAAFGPAARAAGASLLIGLLLAGAVAYCNAMSSARLAALYPESGGTYAYGRRQLGNFWGYLAGWGFVAGKLASCAAMALTFGYYTAPSLARPLAVAATVGLTIANLLGVTKVAGLARTLVAVVLASLATFVVAALAGGTVSTTHLSGLGDAAPIDILRSAGFLFFAFAGYARIATMGEEVREPARTLPRAIPLALGLTLVVYLAVALAALLAVDPGVLAASSAPLKAVLEAGSLDELTPVVAIGAAVASLGVLLSLLAGVSRTVFAMAANADLPRQLAAVATGRRVPDRALVAVAALTVAISATVDVRSAIGFSSFCVLVYYAIANVSALSLRAGRRVDAVAGAGLVGCLALALTVPARSLGIGAAVLAAGALVYALRGRRSAPDMRRA